MQERPIPAAAVEDKDSVEMLRVWIAGGGLHTSLKVGMYKETMNVSEEKAWGKILADTARHISRALAQGYDAHSGTSLDLIKQYFNAQLEKPSTDIRGSVLKK